jgi:NAD(P)-dependent dehydrogenase (short-subunit alcohol dehydrogenase family)
VTDSLHAYQLAKRGNSLRVMAEAVRWGERGARVNTISPGIVMTPLAKDELFGPRGAGYRRMIEGSAARRAGTPDDQAFGSLMKLFGQSQKGNSRKYMHKKSPRGNTILGDVPGTQ